MTLCKQSVAWMLCWALLVATSVSAAGAQSSTAQGQAAEDADLTSKELDDLVSPIALYPDALVRKILAAATYPDQITAASDWLTKNSGLKDQALMEAADKQDWDPSVKALTQFPSVLDNMVKNLAWTSAFGEASYYQQKDLMAAIQRLRKQAKSAGNLKSGQQICRPATRSADDHDSAREPDRSLCAGVQPNRGLRHALLPAVLQHACSGGSCNHFLRRRHDGRDGDQQQQLLPVGMALWRMGLRLARRYGGLSPHCVRVAQSGVSRRLSRGILGG